MSPPPKPDHWSSTKYHAAASFVPHLTTTLLSYLSPAPTDHILDLGCGDGLLTAHLARQTPSGRVLGLDASASFITTAQNTYASSTHPNLRFRLQDCTDLGGAAEIVDGSWDKVFSNAAMHWILRKEETREAFFRDVRRALRPGGRFVFEMGGKGNVAEIDAAFAAAIMHAGFSREGFCAVRPWFFPSVEWMRGVLGNAGFEVERCEAEYRPTRLTPETEGGDGGIEGWLRLMGAQFLEAVEGEGRREAVLREVMEAVEHVITREEDGSRWIGNVRLRAVARKKE
ncbi:methyltransferase [Teratosphaeria nubilosa]|uniref:Methyltransferase n=1 Tax=Teratosphaeria nubilosa TaxID=161662 RepID=A0A6G1LGE0_9PEZI|nr:methyltransferase [Teratosphaeria nubilosa]